ncbi:MAG: amino acid adenylation domain-containing protein [Coleofasciculus sp.]
MAQQSDANPSSEVTSKNLVYVIYTSGSTGKPKGVAIEHRQLLNYLNGIINQLDLPRGASFATISTFAADLGNTAIFSALCTGGCLHIISQEGATNPEALADYCNHHPIDCLKIVPSHLKALLSASHPEKILPKKHLILGGEALSWTLVENLKQYAPSCQIINHYGPTEATIGVLTYSIEDESIQQRSQTVPMGRPLANTQVYILDEYLQPVPMGVPGELYIGGNNLARGYLNQPELTNERFIPNPFSHESESRLYKTGDLARYLPDGTIEFLGRIDNQIKIRGFRIEPGEIESVLRQNPEVQDVAVLVREDDSGGKRLVAYVIPRQGKTFNTSELRHFLKEKLPDYMMPSAFVLLKNLPLTANGKVDFQVLRSLEITRPDLEDAFVTPRTPVEESLARTWAELLRLEQVGVHDNFFDLGGHSLLVTQVVSRLRDTFAVELPLSNFFDAPTIADLAVIITQRLAEQTDSELLEKRDNVSPQKIKPQPRHSSTFPLSFAQARLWFLEQLEPGNPFYNQSAAVHLLGRLNLAALEQSFNEILRRHEVLRTTFTVVEGQPVQVIAPTLPLTLPVVDLQELPEAERKGEVLRRATEEGQQSFNLSKAPLLRCTLLRLDEIEYVLLFTMHHIISDAWSKGVLLRELAILYEAFSIGKPSPLPELPIQYADFAVWQQQWLQGEVLETQLTYWRHQLEGSPPLLELPTDRTRPPVQTFRGATQSFILPKALTEALKELSKQEDVTLFMTLLAAFKTLLYRYTGQNDILVGSPIANRNRSEIEGLIGFFVNTLVMRTNLGGRPSFRELLSRVRNVALAAYAHQDLPFERLVNELQLERDLSHTPLFQVMFEFGNTPISALALPGLTLNLLETESSTAKFDLSLSMRETEQGLIGSLEYNTDLFDAGTIARMLGHFQTLVASILANPDQPLEDLQLLTDAEKQQLLVEWNDTGADYPQNQCIHQLFEAQVEQTPDAVAVVFEDQQLTYRELNARANQLAHHLQKLGVKPEGLVGLCVERSLEMVVGVLGILKAGGAYVPLDPGYPQERLVFMLEDANVPVLLTTETLLSRLPEYQAQVVYLDADWEQISQERDRNPISQVTTQNLAYLIYTSGSTGKPKGVQILHSALVNFLSAMRLTPGLTQEDTLLSVTPLSFDIAALELYLPLIVGARLVVVHREVAADGTRLLEQLASSGATVIQATPATWRMLLAAGWEGSGSLKILCGGETLNRELAIELLERGTELWNLYGPTETTIWSTAYKVDSQKSDFRGGEVISIGRPIANTKLYVLDQNQQPVPVGIIGELHIGGLGLARGYLDKPELTSEKFISNPFNSDPASRLYKTGDLVRYRPDGTLEYISRMDHQVKIRGFRIELGEIEAVLSQHPAVRETVVLAHEKVQGDKRLIAYIVTQQQPAPSISDLRHFLKEKLPEYMVSSVFVPLEALPLTPNGKVDRNALPVPDNFSPDLDVAYVMPRNEVEQRVAKIWQDILGVEQVGIYDNFFELGGHSLLATQVISQMCKAFQVELPLRHLFEAPTVADQAFAIQQKQGEKDSQSPNPISKIERINAEQVLANLNQMSEQDVDSLLQKMLAEQEVNS